MYLLGIFVWVVAKVPGLYKYLVEVETEAEVAAETEAAVVAEVLIYYYCCLLMIR